MNNELYQEVLLQHSKRPKNFGTMDQPTHVMEGYNALCGDEIFVMLQMLDGKILDVKFTGSSCAICTASASIMTHAIKGVSCELIEELAQKFRHLVKDGTEADLPAAMMVMGGVHKYPQRVKCAILPWETLIGALKLSTSQSLNSSTAA
ncbi:MAG: Fe-S cluster assembly sulfur transfer protein SufU [Chthoniobacterales bacterium]